MKWHIKGLYLKNAKSLSKLKKYAIIKAKQSTSKSFTLDNWTNSKLLSKIVIISISHNTWKRHK